MAQYVLGQILQVLEHPAAIKHKKTESDFHVYRKNKPTKFQKIFLCSLNYFDVCNSNDCLSLYSLRDFPIEKKWCHFVD